MWRRPSASSPARPLSPAPAQPRRRTPGHCRSSRHRHHRLEGYSASDAPDALNSRVKAPLQRFRSVPFGHPVPILQRPIQALQARRNPPYDADALCTSAATTAPGEDFVLEYGELRFTFNERDFRERCEQAARKLGFIGGVGRRGRGRGSDQPRRQRRGQPSPPQRWASTSTTAGPTSWAPRIARSSTGCAG